MTENISAGNLLTLVAKGIYDEDFKEKRACFYNKVPAENSIDQNTYSFHINGIDILHGQHTILEIIEENNSQTLSRPVHPSDLIENVEVDYVPCYVSDNQTNVNDCKHDFDNKQIAQELKSFMLDHIYSLSHKFAVDTNPDADSIHYNIPIPILKDNIYLCAAKSQIFVAITLKRRVKDAQLLVYGELCDSTERQELVRLDNVFHNFKTFIGHTYTATTDSQGIAHVDLDDTNVTLLSDILLSISPDDVQKGSADQKSLISRTKLVCSNKFVLADLSRTMMTKTIPRMLFNCLDNTKNGDVYFIPLKNPNNDKNSYLSTYRLEKTSLILYGPPNTTLTVNITLRCITWLKYTNRQISTSLHGPISERISNESRDQKERSIESIDPPPMTSIPSLFERIKSFYTGYDKID